MKFFYWLKVKLALLMMLLATGLFAQNNYFVAKTGNDQNDGKTWKSAFLTIEGAIKKAYGSNDKWIGSGDPVVDAVIPNIAEINLYVAEGDYKMTETIYLDDRVMVHIKGGFPEPTANTVALDLCTSVPSEHKTTIFHNDNGSCFKLRKDRGGLTLDGLYFENLTGTAGQGALVTVGELGNGFASNKTLTMNNTVIKKYTSGPVGVLYFFRYNNLDVNIDGVVAKSGKNLDLGGTFISSSNGAGRNNLHLSVFNTVFNNITTRGVFSTVFSIDITASDNTDDSYIVVEKSSFCSNEHSGSTNAPALFSVNSVKNITFKENYFTRSYADMHSVGLIRGVYQFNAQDNIYQGNTSESIGAVWGFLSTAGTGYKWETVAGSKISFTHDRFFRNSAGTSSIGGQAGAIRLYVDTPIEIDNCKFVENRTAGNQAGALLLESNAPKIIKNSVFCRNVAGVQGGTRSQGGAIVSTYSGDLTITNCTFNGNYSEEEGGAIYHTTSLLTLKNCYFEDNYTKDNNKHGGAVYIWKGSSKIDSCVFKKNYTAGSANGGALDLEAGSGYHKVTNSMFIENHADDGGAVNIYNINGTQGIEFTKNIFRNNYARNNAGALSCGWTPNMQFAENEYDGNETTYVGTIGGGYGGAVVIYTNNRDIIYTSISEIFKSNIGSLGGAVYLDDGDLSANIIGAKYYANTAKRQGGAIYSALNTSEDAFITNSEFFNNTAEETGAGGAMYIYPLGKYAWDKIDDCIFEGNKANGSDIGVGVDIRLRYNSGYIEYLTNNKLQNVVNSTNYPRVNSSSGNTKITAGTLSEPVFQLSDVITNSPACIVQEDVPPPVCREGEEVLPPSVEMSSNPDTNMSDRTYVAVCENTEDAAVTFCSPTGTAPFTFTYDRIETLDGVSYGSGTLDSLTITTLDPPTYSQDQVIQVPTADGIVNQTITVQVPRTDVETSTQTIADVEYTITKGYNFVTITAPASEKGTLFSYLAKQVKDSYYNPLTETLEPQTSDLTCATMIKAEIFFKDCTDSDADGYADTNDLDDDNDGILDSEECAILSSATIDANYVNNDASVMRITPSDLELSDGTGTIIDKDISDQFGYPANSGAVVVSIANYKVVGGEWVTVSDQKAVWTVKGGLARYVVTDYSTSIPAHSGIEIYIFDGTRVEASPSNPVSTPGQFVVIDNPANPYAKYFANVSDNPITEIFRYIAMLEGDRYFKFALGISESLGANVSATYQVGLVLDCDEDQDAIPNRLDLDTDGDDCPDALEGTANLMTANLVDAGGYLAIQAGKNLCTDATCVSTNDATLGVPTVVNAGQAVGNSQDASTYVCYINLENDINQTPQGISVSANVLTNDEGDISTVTKAMIGSIEVTVGTETIITGGKITINANGIYTFTPNVDFIGKVPTITYTAANSVAIEGTANLDIVVIPNIINGNNSPVAINDYATVPAGCTATVNMLNNDSDVDGDALTVDLSAGATTALGSDGTPLDLTATDQDVYVKNESNTCIKVGTTKVVNNEIVFMPVENFIGDVLFKYTVKDIYGGIDTANVLVTVEGAVEVNNDIFTIQEGETVSGNCFTNDLIEGSVISFTVNEQIIDLTSGTTTSVNVENGTLTIHPNGSFTFIPTDSKYEGTIIIPYTVCNATTCGTASVVIDVVEPITDGSNNSLVANPDELTITKASPATTLNLMSNDYDANGMTGVSLTEVTALTLDGSALILTGTEQTVYDANGVEAGVAKVVNSEIVFTPTSNFVGDVHFSYTISNGTSAKKSIATIHVMDTTGLTNADNSVTANDDVNQGKLGVQLTGNILINDTDSEGDNFIVVKIDANGDGVFEIFSNGTATNIMHESIKIGTLTLTINGAYTWIPKTTFVGTAIIPYQIQDDNTISSATDNATLYLTTNAPLMFANDDITQVPEGTTLTGNVLSNDTGTNLTVTKVMVDGVEVTVGIEITITGGKITVNTDGSYTFVPNANFTGKVPTITYTTMDSFGNTYEADLKINVIPKLVNGNNLPVISDDVLLAEERGSTVSTNVLDNDSDPDGDSLTVTSTTVGDGYHVGSATGGRYITIGSTEDVYDDSGKKVGTITVNADGTTEFTPVDDFTGEIPITYITEDGKGGSGIGTLTVEVLKKGQLANLTANDDNVVGAAGAELTINPLANDQYNGTSTVTQSLIIISVSLLDGTSLTKGTSKAIVGKGTIEWKTDGSVVFIPNVDFVGTLDVNYIVKDDVTIPNTDKAMMHFTSLKPLPINLNNDVVQTSMNTAVTANVLTNDSGAGLSVDDTDDSVTIADGFKIGSASGNNKITVRGSNAIYKDGSEVGSITINTDGIYTFEPRNGFVGDLGTITYTAKDNSSNTKTATLDIKVLEDINTGNDDANDAPVALDDYLRTNKNTAVTFNIMANDHDADLNRELTVTKIRLVTSVSGIATTYDVPETGSIIKDVYDGTTQTGSIEVAFDGSLTFTPTTHYVGNVPPIEYRIDDAHEGTDQAKIYIKILDNQTNNLFANDDYVFVRNAGDIGKINILDNDFDQESEDITIQNVWLYNSSGTLGLVAIQTRETLNDRSVYDANGTDVSLAGKLSLDATGRLIYKGDPNYSGTFVIPYSIKDTYGNIVKANIYITQQKPDDTPLPIVLYNFTAKLNQEAQVLLEWTSLVEINNDYYNLYKSEDGIHWNLLAELEGTGNSSVCQNYSFVDVNPYQGIGYYRLVQTDFDGTTKDLGIRSVKFTGTLGSDELELYPNPARNFVTFEGHFQDLNTLQILDIRGVDLSSRVNFLSESKYKIKLDIRRLPKGIYVFRIDNLVGKFIKQ